VPQIFQNKKTKHYVPSFVGSKQKVVNTTRHMAKKMAPTTQKTLRLSSQGRMLKNGTNVDPSNGLRTARIYKQFKSEYHALELELIP
jgi:hypothetical protein